MKAIEKVVQELGAPYQIKNIDLEDVIYRDLGSYEFEVSGFPKKSYTLYVWAKMPCEVIGIYEGIPADCLKDILGYYAVKYQNLTGQIRILREEKKG